MAEDKRHVQLRFDGPAVQRGKITVDVLIQTLKNLQDAVYQLGRFHLEKGVIGSRGRIPQRVKDTCTLQLTGTNQGSFVADLELNENTEQLSLFNDEKDLGEKSLETLSAIMINFNDGKGHEVRSLIPDVLTRNRTLRFIRNMIPEKSAGYSVYISFDDEKTAPLTPDFFGDIDELLLESVEESQVTLVGRVVEIQVEPTRWFHISLSGGRRIKCYFEQDLDAALFQAIDQLIEIRGTAQRDGRGQLQSINRVYDVKIIDLDPLSFDQILGKDRVFILKEHLHAVLSYEDGLFFIENERFNILGYGPTREQAVQDFQRYFEFLWHEYAEADDQELTPDAKKLKDALRSLVTREDETYDF